MNGKPWLPQHTATLERMAGDAADADIARETGHCVRTVRDRRNAAQLPAYHPARPAWTRRDWLMAGAAGYWPGETLAT